MTGLIAVKNFEPLKDDKDDKLMPNKALITGINELDGSYLSELLLSKGYEVHGIIWRASAFNTG